MEILQSESGDKTVLTIIGRLDTATAPQLQEVLIPLINSNTTQVELDLAGLTYISSAGLRVLLLGEKNANTQDSLMSIVNVGADVKEIFEITGFSEFLKIV